MEGKTVTFSERLRTLILEKGCSQKELADYLGVKPNTVSNWVHRSASPKVEHLYAMVEFFNVDFDYLFTGSKSTRNALSEDERELLGYYGALSDRLKDRELGRLQSLAEEHEERRLDRERVEKNAG